MDTRTLRCIVKCDPVLSKQVVGIFALNEIPDQISNFPAAFIVNTDKKGEPGTHWLAMYFPSKDKAEFFDSFGQRPSFYSNIFKKIYTKNIINNGRKIQGDTSWTCGCYCIYFLAYRCRGVAMDTIVQHFSSNYEVNDTFVCKFVEHTFPYCSVTLGVVG